VSQLSQTEVERMASILAKAQPVEATSSFDLLLAAIDVSDRRARQAARPAHSKSSAVMMMAVG
jgi:hypothetical protein